MGMWFMEGQPLDAVYNSAFKFLLQKVNDMYHCIYHKWAGEGDNISFLFIYIEAFPHPSPPSLTSLLFGSDSSHPLADLRLLNVPKRLSRCGRSAFFFKKNFVRLKKSLGWPHCHSWVNYKIYLKFYCLSVFLISWISWILLFSFFFLHLFSWFYLFI